MSIESINQALPSTRSDQWAAAAHAAKVSTALRHTLEDSLGMTRTQLADRLKDGTSISAIAASRGVDPAHLAQSLTHALTSNNVDTAHAARIVTRILSDTAAGSILQPAAPATSTPSASTPSAGDTPVYKTTSAGQMSRTTLEDTLIAAIASKTKLNVTDIEKRLISGESLATIALTAGTKIDTTSSQARINAELAGVANHIRQQSPSQLDTLLSGPITNPANNSNYLQLLALTHGNAPAVRNIVSQTYGPQ